MKKPLQITFAFTFLAFLSTGFTVKTPIEEVAVQNNDKIVIQGAVKEIIENKCMGCHKPDARNEKARKKLQWAKVPGMSKEEQKHFIDELFEVLEEGKMPPERMVNRFPKMKLTDEETKTLLAWAEKEEKRLKGT